MVFGQVYIFTHECAFNLIGVKPVYIYSQSRSHHPPHHPPYRPSSLYANNNDSSQPDMGVPAWDRVKDCLPLQLLRTRTSSVLQQLFESLRGKQRIEMVNDVAETWVRLQLFAVFFADYCMLEGSICKIVTIISRHRAGNAHLMRMR